MVSKRYFIAKRYTDDHEWISVEDGVGTIGITDYAQKVNDDNDDDDTQA